MSFFLDHLQVRRLNSELHALGVFTTDQVEPNQRVPYEAVNDLTKDAIEPREVHSLCPVQTIEFISRLQLQESFLNPLRGAVFLSNL